MGQSAWIQRKQLLRRLENFLETPLIILGFVWLILLIIELVGNLDPLLEKTGYVIWGVFIVDFIIKLLLAPDSGQYLKANVITLISLVVPAFRIFRMVRIIRLLRISGSFRLVRVIGSLNRGMRALGATMKRRAFGYVLMLTLLVLIVGSAGMYAFEKDEGLPTFGASLWWTTMLLTTMGSEYWPKTNEGRILCIVLAIYAFAVFGYVTATIATFFIGRDTERSDGQTLTRTQVEELRNEIRELRQSLDNRQ